MFWNKIIWIVIECSDCYTFMAFSVVENAMYTFNPSFTNDFKCLVEIHRSHDIYISI